MVAKAKNTQELALLRLAEIGTSCTELATELLEEQEKLEPTYVELLNRWQALTERIVAVTDATNKHEFNPSIAIKLMFLEMQTQLKNMETTGINKKVLPQASVDNLRREVDSIVTSLEKVDV